MKLLVTGANGFVGTNLCKVLLARGYNIRAAIRSQSKLEVFNCGVSKNCEFYVVGDINSTTNWMATVKDVDVIIHLVARAHILQETAKNPLAKFREINVFATKKLADAALHAKVRRFIYISSIGINGQVSHNNPFTENDQPNPVANYAQSKLEAEQALQEIASGTSLETVIIRPPLVYGPNVKGNFLSLLNLVNKGIPFLPLGALNNKRSFVGVNNLADFIICCIEHPKAANETFLIADGKDITTTQLIKTLMKYMGKKRPLLPVPANLLSVIGKLPGKQDAIEKLCAPLQVNIDKAKQLLNWQPVQSLQNGLKETIEWYNTKK